MRPRESRKAKPKKYICERRGTKRLLCSDLVQLTWSEADGAPRAEVGILENMSLSGVGLFLGVRVPDGSPIKMAANHIQLSGAVRSCCFRENGFVVGVELDLDSKWAQEPNAGFLPEHLLDVSLLELD